MARESRCPAMVERWLRDYAQFRPRLWPEIKQYLEAEPAPAQPRKCNCGSHPLAPGYHRPTCPMATAIQREAASQPVEDAPTFAEHVEHVSRFLNEMYATMIDPVDQPHLKVKELCDLLLMAARQQRQALYDLSVGSHGYSLTSTTTKSDGEGMDSQLTSARMNAQTAAGSLKSETASSVEDSAPLSAMDWWISRGRPHPINTAIAEQYAEYVAAPIRAELARAKDALRVANIDRMSMDARIMELERLLSEARKEPRE